MKNITSKTTFTAIAALFFATSLYATDMKSNEMSMAKDSMPMTKDAMPMQNDKMASDGMMKSHDMKSHRSFCIKVRLLFTPRRAVRAVF